MRSYKHVCDYLPFKTVYTAKIFVQYFFLFYFFKIIHQKSNITIVTLETRALLLKPQTTFNSNFLWFTRKCYMKSYHLKIKKNIIKNEFLLQPLIKYIIFKRNLMQK